MELPAFLSQKAPPGYVAGVGRGATGFTTRSDLGSGKTPGRLRDDRSNRADGNEPDDIDDSGSGVANRRDVRFEDTNGLSLAPHRLEEEDKEADRIYNEIDAQLARRKGHKKANVEQAPSTSGLQQISQQFVDLKRSLATVSEEQWGNLPEAGDITGHNKRQRLELQSERKTYAAPDSLISNNIDLTKLTQEREKLLGRQLDESLNSRADNPPDSNDAVDQYLRELDNSTTSVASGEQVQDLQRMRTILTSYRKSDPKKPQGWIASARLEERANKFRLAKSLIEEGCSECPYSEDVWLENLRLHAADLHYCKILVAQALRYNDDSLALWIKATELEREPLNKVRVLRKAIQKLPLSEELWKLAVKFEDDKEQAIKILKKATELIPKSITLLTALINLQDHKDARITLNQARQNNPSDVQVWILALQLEERCDKATTDKLVKLLLKGINELSKNGKTLTLKAWLIEAAKVEEDFPGLYEHTACAITIAAINSYYESLPFEKIMTIVDAIDTRHSNTLRSAHRCLLEKEPHRLSLWKKFINICEAQSKKSEAYYMLDKILFSSTGKAISTVPVLVLMFSKMVWQSDGDSQKAIEILDQALFVEPRNVEFWLAKSKLLVVRSEFEAAENLLKSAISALAGQSGLERVFHRFISFLRYRGRTQEALQMLENDFLDQAPYCGKLYLQWGQIQAELGNATQSRECYAIGTRKLPENANLWIALAHADESLLNQPTRARSDFEIALLKVPKENSEPILVAQVQMEKKLGNTDQARLLVTRALKQFPSSALLWVEHLKLITKKSLKRTAYQDALKNANSDPNVLLEIGSSLYSDANYEKALKWFERATNANPLYGDAWIWLSRCNKKMGRDLDPVLSRVKEVEPRYGTEWIRVSKNVANIYLSPTEVLLKSLSILN